MTSLRALPSPCPDDCLDCWLSGSLDLQGCDEDYAHVEEWAEERGADLEALIELAQDRGGFCDCEVLLNLFTGARLVLGDVVLSCGS